MLDKNYDQRRIADAAEQALTLGNGELIITEVKDKTFEFPNKPKEMVDTLFSEKFACSYCGISVPELEPRLFSFNSPQGACARCNGLGVLNTIDVDLVLAPDLTIAEGGILPYQDVVYKDTWFARTLRQFLNDNNIPTNLRIKHLTREQKEILLYGTGEKLYEVEGTNRFGEKTKIYETYYGVINDLQNKYRQTESEMVKHEIEKFMFEATCDVCHGARLKKEALGVSVNGKSIVEVSTMSISAVYDFISILPEYLTPKENEIGRLVLREIESRLRFLKDVGLSYLTLGRSAQTLAGGEAQRIRLASQIGSGLSGVLYVLDEPSIGLHPRDNTKLIDTLLRLRDLGNTVVVVEHDKEMMKKADYIFDIGPGAGEHGGRIIAKGTPEEIVKNENSITGPYLSGKKKIAAPQITEKLFSDKVLRITGVSEHNLKNVDVSFPLGNLICVTGVSGSGKSTLVNDVLYHAIAQKKNPFHRQRPGAFGTIEGDEEIRRVFMIDQSPIGRTPRSNPITYTGAFTFIRDIFANTRDARLRGYTPGRFSFNVKGGRCENCEGEGQIKIEMQFLPDVYVDCEICNGSRYTRDTLEITFEGKNIAEILNMTVEEAENFFSFHQGLHHKLSTLVDVGLSYIRLGQPAPTLSGGEAQRIKLASELSKKGSGGSLYLLDEPTTGLHFSDIQKLIMVLRRLVENGNTVIVIEHNLDVIKNADYIIDLGPEGGEGGGTIVATGTPSHIAQVSNSHTGRYLANELKL